MTLIPSIQILFFASQFQCIYRVNIHPKKMEIKKIPLTPLISLFGRNMHKPYSILFFHFLHSNHSNLMSYTSISLIPNQFRHVIHNALSDPNHHSLYFSNPNLIHFFLKLYQNHHDSTLNTTNLTSIQENQGISLEKHKNQLCHQ